MPARFNTPPKQSIRTDWAKPILSFLRYQMNKKLFYLGLPSEEALDIKAWLEHIDKVYAFMCRNYKKPSHPSQDRKTVIELDNYLRSLQRRREISSYQVFDGFMEEVVLRGEDNSPEKKPFTIDDVVTVYNLDYCNSLTSPLKYVDKLGNHVEAYKFNAIKTLMNMQAAVPTAYAKKFILFLTIHCSYFERNPGDFQEPLPEEYSDYLQVIEQLPTPKEKAPYLLKAYSFYNLTSFFITNNFLPEFLPVIHYIGNGGQPLLFITVVGTQIPNQPGNPRPLQKRDDFLRGKFISVGNDGNFINNTDLVAHNEVNWAETDSVALFKNSKTFRQHWQV
jgi:hypothetical protein